MKTNSFSYFFSTAASTQIETLTHFSLIMSLKDSFYTVYSESEKIVGQSL